jgi:hypothetical protein
MTSLRKAVAGITALAAVLLLAPAATAEQKSRVLIDNEGYLRSPGGPFTPGFRANPGAGPGPGPFFLPPQGTMRGHSGVQPVGGNATETIGIGRTHTVRTGPKGKKQARRGASGDPDQPIISGRLYNTSTQPVGGNTTETIGIGRTHTVRHGVGSQSSTWMRTQQHHTTGSAFPSRPFGAPGRMNWGRR